MRRSERHRAQYEKEETVIAVDAIDAMLAQLDTIAPMTIVEVVDLPTFPSGGLSLSIVHLPEL
jgi:hypothetical protein